jgi:hypothetical protein
MSSHGITRFEDLIESRKQEYYSCLLDSTSLYIKGIDPKEARDVLFRLHNKGTAYFNIFVRSVDEFSLPAFGANENILNRKVEDAVSIADRIVAHWKLIRTFSQKYSLEYFVPDDNAYSSLQRFIRKYNPDKSEKLKQEFMNAQLPVSGFEGKLHKGWKFGEEKMTWTQIVIGLVFIVVSGIIIFTMKELSGMQYMFVRAMLSLGLTLVGTALLEGTIQLNWTIKKSLSVKAAGWVALFILLNFINPPSAPLP